MAKKAYVAFATHTEKDIQANKATIFAEEGKIVYSERYQYLSLGNGKYLRYDDETSADYSQNTEPTDPLLGEKWFNPDTKELKEYTTDDAGNFVWVLTSEESITQEIINNSLEIQNFESFVSSLSE